MTVLQTGGGQPLVSSQQTLSFATNGSSVTPILTFNFGFVTSEAAAPGVVLDSFSVSVQDQLANLALLFTADASGVTWAPVTVGGVPITDADVVRQSITPPGDSPVLGQGYAYSVQFALPQQFSADPLTVYFDLFDNQDANMSLGWYDNLQFAAPVPEPQTYCLIGLGLALITLKNKFHR